MAKRKKKLTPCEEKALVALQAQQIKEKEKKAKEREKKREKNVKQQIPGSQVFPSLSAAMPVVQEMRRQLLFPQGPSREDKDLLSLGFNAANLITNYALMHAGSWNERKRPAMVGTNEPPAKKQAVGNMLGTKQTSVVVEQPPVKQPSITFAPQRRGGTIEMANLGAPIPPEPPLRFDQEALTRKLASNIENKTFRTAEELLPAGGRTFRDKVGFLGDVVKGVYQEAKDFLTFRPRSPADFTDPYAGLLQQFQEDSRAFEKLPLKAKLQRLIEEHVNDPNNAVRAQQIKELEAKRSNQLILNDTLENRARFVANTLRIAKSSRLNYDSKGFKYILLDENTKLYETGKFDRDLGQEFKQQTAKDRVKILRNILKNASSGAVQPSAPSTEFPAELLNLNAEFPAGTFDALVPPLANLSTDHLQNIFDQNPLPPLEQPASKSLDQMSKSERKAYYDNLAKETRFQGADNKAQVNEMEKYPAPVVGNKKYEAPQPNLAPDDFDYDEYPVPELEYDQPPVAPVKAEETKVGLLDVKGKTLSYSEPRPPAEPERPDKIPGKKLSFSPNRAKIPIYEPNKTLGTIPEVDETLSERELAWRKAYPLLDERLIRGMDWDQETSDIFDQNTALRKATAADIEQKKALRQSLKQEVAKRVITINTPNASDDKITATALQNKVASFKTPVTIRYQPQTPYSGKGEYDSRMAGDTPYLKKYIDENRAYWDDFDEMDAFINPYVERQELQTPSSTANENSYGSMTMQEASSYDFESDYKQSASEDGSLNVGSNINESIGNEAL